jgi:hypothetical protein
MRALPLLTAVVLLSACGDYAGEPAVADQPGHTDNAPGPDGGASDVDDPVAIFQSQIQPTLGLCRTCHVPGGVADVEEGRRFLLSNDAAEDYDHLYAAWDALGRGVVGSPLLIEPGDANEPHSGGKPWPQGGVAYLAMQALLTCWDDPDACIAGSGGEVTELPPLLGNPGKHFFVNQLCDGAPDSTPIDWSQDPRRLLQQSEGLIDSQDYAVHFNDPYEICHTDTLFETQARQNELRAAEGLEPIYTAKPDPATCGQWREAVRNGHDWIAMTPTDSPPGGGHDANTLNMITGTTNAVAWNNLWRVWGMDARPERFDEQLFERYGHTPPPDHVYNPYPIIDPNQGIDERGALSETFGGSGRLPLGYAQGRDENGVYTGTMGVTCFSCHAGQIGSGEVTSRDGNLNLESYGANATGSFMGLPNTNTELGVLIADLINARQYGYPGPGEFPLSLPAFGYIPLVNTTRGTNAADTEIEAIVAIRDFDSLEFSHVLSYPLHASMGDQDPPAWWWLSNKTRYLWFGGHSTDSSRGNMYFGSVNALSGADVKGNEGTFEDVHQWTLTVEAPDYLYGYCAGTGGEPAAADHPGCIRRPLAEQGAILFHEKDLWADGENADIPRPGGNGSCAGCHGAYSPRYINDQRFLPDPKLAGTVGYTVPIEIVDTDPAQAEGWAKELREHVSTFWWSYPDAVEGYVLPEEKDPLTELLDDYAFLGVSGDDLADHLARNLDDNGALQPVSTIVADTAGIILGPIPNIPAGEFANRVKGACSFEEKTVGYVTPPLHGVWASAPYFHNGSVPTIWGVLQPEDRPAVWRRQRTTTDVHFNAFETRLSGYDFDQLGWNYDLMNCGDGSQGIPYYTCQPATDAPEELQWVADTVLGGLLWPTWVVPPPYDTRGLEDRMIFNTNMYSKKNRGHEWTRTLTDTERRALMEYMKTL